MMLSNHTFDEYWFKDFIAQIIKVIKLEVMHIQGRLTEMINEILARRWHYNSRSRLVSSFRGDFTIHNDLNAWENFMRFYANLWTIDSLCMVGSNDIPIKSGTVKLWIPWQPHDLRNARPRHTLKFSNASTVTPPHETFRICWTA